MGNFNFLIGFIILKISAAQQTWPTDTYQPGVCICVPAGSCAIGSSGGNTDGRGALDPRISTSGGIPQIITGTINNTCQPVSTGIQISAQNQVDCSYQKDLELCCPTPGYTCGLRYPPVDSATTPTSGSGQALYGNHPWLIAIFDMTKRYVGSGVLISHLHAITAAHKVYNETSPLIIRMNEYDMSRNNLPFPKLEIEATFEMHPSFVLRSLKNNIALLTLKTAAPLGKYPTLTNMCIPNVTLSGIRCWVAGWGQDFFVGGSMQRVMREIDVPLIEQDDCERMLRNNTVLGPLFLLDRNSFVCAGGEAGKDACTGDGGAPLSCYVYDRFYLMGLSSWGMGCGQANIPGVYTNVQSYVGWIQQTIRKQSVRSTTNTTTSKTPRSGDTGVTESSAISGSTTLRQSSTGGSTTAISSAPVTTTSKQTTKAAKASNDGLEVKGTRAPVQKRTRKTTKRRRTKTTTTKAATVSQYQ